MYYASICAIYRNETPWLEEWIRYYLATGIEHFYLYCNDDDPGPSAEVLRPYIEKRQVDMIYFPGRYQQFPVYRNAMRFAKETRWLACLDLDEFVLPRNTDSIPELLQNYEDAPGLVINWTVFGSSGLIEYPPNQINHFLYRAPDDFAPNKHIKSFVQTSFGAPQGYAEAVNEHHDATILDPKKLFIRKFTADYVRIIHYVVRNRRYFDEVKSVRGRADGPLNDRNETFWKGHDRNDIYDDELSRRFGHLCR